MSLKYNWAWEQKHSVKSSLNQANYINEFIAGCKVDAIWNGLDRWAMLAVERQAQARVYLNSPSATQITEVNSPTFTAKQGYTGNGTSSYLNANYNTNSGTNYTQDSASIGGYQRTNAVGFFALIANWSGTSPVIDAHCYPRHTGDLQLCKVNAATGGNKTNTDSRGFFSSVRPDSANIVPYKNGVSLGATAVASTGKPNVVLYILARNGNGTADSFNAGQAAAAYSGNGVIDQAKLYTRVQNYMTRIAAQV